MLLYREEKEKIQHCVRCLLELIRIASLCLSSQVRRFLMCKVATIQLLEGASWPLEDGGLKSCCLSMFVRTEVALRSWDTTHTSLCSCLLLRATTDMAERGVGRWALGLDSTHSIFLFQNHPALLQFVIQAESKHLVIDLERNE